MDESGALVVDPASRERVLLLLFLFSDVGPDDAPTRIRLGSHLDAARVLAAAGPPADFFAVAADLVHAAQPHRGRPVRFMAQPPLPGTGPIDPTRLDRSPVEEAVHRALHAGAAAS